MSFITETNKKLSNSMRIEDVEKLLNDDWTSPFSDLPEMGFEQFLAKEAHRDDTIIVKVVEQVVPGMARLRNLNGREEYFEVYHIFKYPVTVHETQTCKTLHNDYIKEEKGRIEHRRNSGVTFMENYLLRENVDGTLTRVEGEIVVDNFNESLLGKRGFGQCRDCTNPSSESNQSYWTDEQWQAYDKDVIDLIDNMTTEELSKFHGIE